MIKTIRVELSAKDIESAIKDVKAYRKEFERKLDKLRIKVAQRIEREALANFAGAVCNDVVSGGTRPAAVEIKIKADTNPALIIASGEDAVFCEFGSGVYHNGSVGSSPHPKGAELGFTIGSYGKGFGARRVWGYYKGDDLVLTRGTPATMPMYNAFKTVCDEISAIAQEVFT